MKRNLMLTVTSLLSMLLTSFHHVDDVVRGLAPGKSSNLIPIGFLFVWLYGTTVLADRRAGHIIILVASFLASGLPVIHMTRAGLVGRFVNRGGDFGEFFFVWTLIALGVTALFSVVLSARGLWNPQWNETRAANKANTETPGA